ncbi:SIMPL domain-containing protein [Frondihabitans australicus]|uniref:SIMPL domain-containing protein n=1 Tax=Frondihabitans australicus TaxID=386892 RepID=A0A495IHZ9_9MICO|nr:SIMPL domain-containing protein [Frondihabitans australicus]RKR75607.1 hypothetical protein C8E83_2755 [Frondihabitans australicus]
MTTFVVHGQATLSHPAQIATLTVTVVARGDDRAELASLVSEDHALLLAQLDALGDAAPERSSGGLVTDTYYDYPGDGQSILRSRARVSTVLVFTDFALLGRLAGDWASEPLFELDGLSWTLSDETSHALIRRARVDAVNDAVGRAAEYAAALGAGSPTLERLYEDGLRPSGGGGGGFAKAMMMDVGGAGGSGAFDLAPPAIEVSVEISADFVA